MAFGHNGGGFAGGGSGSGGGGASSLHAVKFSAPGVTVAALIGKAPDTQFMVYADNGGGTLLFFDTGINGGSYTFNAGTGAITVPANSGDYRVQY